MDKYLMSKATYEKLNNELNEIKKGIEDELQRLEGVKKAAIHKKTTMPLVNDDFWDNSEYEIAEERIETIKRALYEVLPRKTLLEEILPGAVIIDTMPASVEEQFREAYSERHEDIVLDDCFGDFFDGDYDDCYDDFDDFDSDENVEKERKPLGSKNSSECEESSEENEQSDCKKDEVFAENKDINIEDAGIFESNDDGKEITDEPIDEEEKKLWERRYTLEEIAQMSLEEKFTNRIYLACVKNFDIVDGEYIYIIDDFTDYFLGSGLEEDFNDVSFDCRQEEDSFEDSSDYDQEESNQNDYEQWCRIKFSIDVKDQKIREMYDEEDKSYYIRRHSHEYFDDDIFNHYRDFIDFNRCIMNCCLSPEERALYVTAALEGKNPADIEGIDNYLFEAYLDLRYSVQEIFNSLNNEYFDYCKEKKIDPLKPEISVTLSFDTSEEYLYHMISVDDCIKEMEAGNTERAVWIAWRSTWLDDDYWDDIRDTRNSALCRKAIEYAVDHDKFEFVKIIERSIELNNIHPGFSSYLSECVDYDATKLYLEDAWGDEIGTPRTCSEKMKELLVSLGAKTISDYAAIFAYEYGYSQRWRFIDEEDDERRDETGIPGRNDFVVIDDDEATEHEVIVKEDDPRKYEDSCWHFRYCEEGMRREFEKFLEDDLQYEKESFDEWNLDELIEDGQRLAAAITEKFGLYADCVEYDRCVMVFVEKEKTSQPAVESETVTRTKIINRHMQELINQAEEGDSEAQFKVGMLYTSQGNIFHEPDYVEAAKWYGMAAAQGHKHALYNLGFMYWEGVKGIGKDINKSLEYLMKAAELGQPEAQFKVGYAYGTGLGLELNYDEADRWFRKAAVQDHPIAQYNCFEFYAENDEDEMVRYYAEPQYQFCIPMKDEEMLEYFNPFLCD